MKINQREKQLLQKYDTPESVCVVTSYPSPGGESAERNAIANYSRELVLELGKKKPVVVIAEVLDTPDIYEENGILIIRAFTRNSYLMNFQIIKTLALFSSLPQVIMQFEFGVYGGSVATFLLALLGYGVKIIGKKYTLMMHQVTHDLGELAEHLGMSTTGYKPFLYNTGMRWFYRLSGWGSDRLLVHTPYLAKKLSRYVDSKKVLVVPHGVSKVGSFNRLSSRKKLGWSSKEFVILVFGYLSWYKGSDWIIEHLGPLLRKHSHHHIRLVMAGGESGTLRTMAHYQSFMQKVYSAAAHYGVEITGYVPDSKKHVYFSGADLVIMPHRVAMSESGVMAHVFAYGKPFMVSEARATSIKDPELRKLSSFGYSQSLLEKKLMYLIGHASERKRMVNDVASVAKERSWKHVATQYVAALPSETVAGYTRTTYAKMVS